MAYNTRTPLTPAHEAALALVIDDARLCIDAQTQLWASVAAAREVNITWAEIGRVLGVTRQAAQERFSKPPAGRLV